MINEKDIEREVLARGIQRLCHFTQSRKLAHIFGELNGLLSTTLLKQKHPDLLDRNDLHRYDEREDFICCSVEYPNTWYLERIRNIDPNFKDWVVLSLNPVILCWPNTLFSPRNAASDRGANIRHGYNGFMGIYQQNITGAHGYNFSRRPQMLPSCPTDDQAEVLVYSYIPSVLIEGILVPSIQQAKTEKQRLLSIGIDPQKPWIVSNQVFSGEWSRLVRSGVRPVESLYEDNTNG